MKILIAVPTFESIYPDVYKAIWDVKWNGDPDDLMFDFIKGYDCATARNRIVGSAQMHKADYVLMVDNDVIVPNDIFDILLDEPVDVCLGAYPHRDTDNIYRGRTCICKLYDENGTKYFNYPLESEYTSKELIEFEQQGEKKIEIHGGGMGCAFIKTSIFDEIDYPWYYWVNYADDNRGMLSEDLYFWEQCRTHGIPIYTDVRVRCKHILRHAQECV